MQGSLLRHLRSNAVAYLALFVALGGTSVAAATVITGKNVKNGSLTGKDVRNSSLTGGDVKNKSLTPSDFKGSVQGPRGETGPQGATGPPGPSNPNAVNAQNADTLDGVDSSQFQRVGLVQAGTADQTETEGFSFVIRWDELAQITTDGDADDDNTVRILNTGSQDIRVREPGAASSVAPGNAASVNVTNQPSILIWSVDGTRSWLAVCASDPFSDQVRCQGVANRL